MYNKYSNVDGCSHFLRKKEIYKGLIAIIYIYYWQNNFLSQNGESSHIKNNNDIEKLLMKRQCLKYVCL